MNKLFESIIILLNFGIVSMAVWFMVAVVAYLLTIHTTPPMKRKETVKSEGRGSLFSWSDWVTWIEAIRWGGRIIILGNRDKTQEPSKLNIKAAVKAEGMPWKPLPNVRTFQVQVHPFEGLLALFGIKKRIKPNLILEPYNNGKYNRFVYMQFKKLEKLRTKLDKIGQAKEYWDLAWKLMGSRIYLVMCFRHIFPNWHREMPYWKVMKILKEVDKLVKGRSSQLNYSRVYIPKGDTYRPLGVPTEAWRVYLHAYTNLFYWYVKPEISPSQHGYQPGKGSLTAWQDIFKRLKTAENIYEFDLKNFFGSLRLGEVQNQLYGRYKFPTSEWKFLKALNLCQPKLGRQQKLDESKVRLYSLEQSGQLPKDKKYNLFNLTSANIDKYNTEGVPQGSPLSPILSILMLEHTLMVNPHCVMYADDGVIFGKGIRCTAKEFREAYGLLPNQKIPDEIKLMLRRVLKDMEDLNIEVNPQKSGMVMKDGKWLKPLKFLGMELYQDGTKIRAKTRNGADAKFSSEEAFLNHLRAKQLQLSGSGLGSETRLDMKTYLEEEYSKYRDNVNRKDWMRLIGGASMGFWVSRLWEPKGGKREQDFYFHYVNQSIISKLTKGFIATALGAKATIFNSSSYCNEWLIKDWTYKSRTSGKVRRIFTW